MFSKLVLPPAVRVPTLILGVTQIVGWGTTMYAPAILATPIVEDTGWSRTAVFGAFSASLVLGALVSRPAGRLIDRSGGRAAMAAGSAVVAAGLAVAALAGSLPVHFAAWVVLGFAMRLTLYEAAFATLAAAGGRDARRAISVLTLPGGLASTIFWPIGWLLLEAFGWRATLGIYAACNLLICLPLHVLFLPRGGGEAARAAPSAAPAGAPGARLRERDRRFALLVLTTAFALMLYINSALSAHLIDILVAFGLSGDLAVTVASLRGVGQVVGRLWELLLAGGLQPVTLCLVAIGLAPLSLATLALGSAAPLAVIFAFGQGASNGLVTIARGVAPLLLFGPKGYGALIGSMAGPGLLAAALAPAAHAALSDLAGQAAALASLIGGALLAFALVALLGLRIRAGDGAV